MTPKTPQSTPSSEQELLKFQEKFDKAQFSGSTTLNIADAALTARDADQIELLQLLKLLRSADCHEGHPPSVETDSAFETRLKSQDSRRVDGSQAVGRFIIRERIGSGGHGVVFRAFDPRVQREVAFKLPKLSSAATPDLRDRFLNEARIAGALDHPNIVRILEAGEISGVLFIVYSLCSGPNLSQWIKEQYKADQFIAEQVVIDIFRQIVDGTAFAHDHGIIHRDLKPSNILLASSRTPISSGSNGGTAGCTFVPCICDYGIAKVFSDDSQLTATGAIIGTPQYMSPEQARGLKHDVGPASDVYSLGVILFEMLTGTTPFQGETNAEIYRRVIEDTPAPIRSLRPDVSADLEAICVKCLEKKIQHRYQCAADLAADLGRYIEGNRVRAYRVRSLRRMSRGLLQRKMPLSNAIWLAGSAVLLFLGLIWIFGAKEQGGSTRILSNASTTGIPAAEPSFAPLELQKRRASYIADMQLGYTMWQEVAEVAGSDVSSNAIPRLLNLHLPGAGEPDLRRFEWHYLNRLVNPQTATARFVPLNDLNGHERDVFSVSFSKDGQYIATGGYDHTTRLWDVQTSEPVRVFRGHANDVNVVRFSPDGKLLATGSDDETIRLWQVDTGNCIGEMNGNDGWVYKLDFSISGELIASGAHDGTVRIWDVNTQTNIATFEDHNRRVLGVEWSQDGHRLATAGTDGTIVIRKYPSFEIEHHIDIASTYKLHRPSSLAFSPDFRLLAIGTYKDKAPNDDGPILIVDLQSGQVVTALRGHQRRVRAVNFVPGNSQDQYTLISTADEGRTLMWDVATGINWEPFPGFPVRCWDLAVSADGRRVAAAGADSLVRLWKTEDETPVRADQRWTVLSSGTSNTFAFSPDSRFIAEGSAASETGGIRLWDLGGNWPRPVGAETGRRLMGVDFSPGGEVLAIAESSGNGTESNITLLDAQSLEEQSRIELSQLSGELNFVKYAPDGRTLFCISRAGQDEHQISIWETATGTLLKSLPCDPEFNPSLKISPDGKTFAVTRMYDLIQDLIPVEIYDLSSLSLLLTTNSYQAKSCTIAFHPANQMIAISSSAGKVSVRDVEIGKELSYFHLDHPHIENLVYSPNGDSLVAGHGNQLAIVSVPEYQVLCSLPTPVDTVYLRSVAFSPDGTVLAAICGDTNGAEKVIFWDSRLPGHAQLP